MKALHRNWLSNIPWDSILTINQTFCKTQNTAHIPKPKQYDAAKALWDQSLNRNLTLAEALDVCRRCHEMAPFEFNNANTFASVGKSILEPAIKNLPAVEGQIVLSTATHFIAGLVTPKELGNVLKHFEGHLSVAPPAPAVLPASPEVSAPIAPPQERPNAGGLAA